MLDLNKPVQTADGCKVRILCTDREGEYPVVGLVTFNNKEIVASWDKNGRDSYSRYSSYDLINVPETLKAYCFSRYCSVTKRLVVYWFNSKNHYDRYIEFIRKKNSSIIVREWVEEYTPPS